MGIQVCIFATFQPDFLLKVHCNGNDKLRDLLYKAIAHIIKGYKLPAVFFFKGKKGCGKSTLLEILKHLLGELYSVLKESDYQRFNSSLRDKLAVALDENQKSSYVNDRVYSEIIKNMKTTATSTCIQIEQKGLDTKNVDIFCTQFLCGNFNLTEEDERRFLIFECGSIYVGNVEYWNEMVNKLKNEDNIKSLYNDLFEQKTDEYFVGNIQNEYKKLNIECKNDAIYEQKNKNGVYYYLHQLAINNKDFKGRRSEICEEIATYLKKSFGYNNISKGTRNFIINDLRDIGMEANKDLKGIYKYNYGLNELTEILKANQILNDEDLAIQAENKGIKEEDLQDGRDETIKLLKEENEKLKMELEEIKKKLPEEHTPKLDLVKNENGIYEKKPEIPGQKEVEEWLAEDQVRRIEFKGRQYTSLKHALFEDKSDN